MCIERLKKPFERYIGPLKWVVPTKCECSWSGGIGIWIYPRLFYIIARQTIDTVFIWGCVLLGDYQAILTVQNLPCLIKSWENAVCVLEFAYCFLIFWLVYFLIKRLLQTTTESETAENVVIAQHNFLALLVSFNGFIYGRQSLQHCSQENLQNVICKAAAHYIWN